MTNRVLRSLCFSLPIFAVLLALACMAAPTLADGLIVVRTGAPAVPGHFSFAPLEVTYHKVECDIKDQVAVTSVDQEFYNPNGGRPLEGEYIFPIPKDAQINKFVMEVNGKPMEAELLPADKARKIYEEIVAQSRDPALLEYAGRAMFKVRIFPIEPNSKKRIQLKYTEFLKSDANLLNYHYTLNTEKFSSKPLKNVSMRVKVESTQPITTLYSPTHEVEVIRDKDNDKKASVGFEAKDIRPDTDFHLYIGRKAAPVGISLLTYKPEADKDGYFVMLAAPTLSKEVKALPKDVVFVMDTSGSMSGAKIEQARKALKFCVNTLNPDDRFDIVRFSTEAEPFFKELKANSDDNRKKALEFIDQMRASGGTAIEDALAAALDERKADKARVFMVVFLTDGQPTVGEQNPDKLITGAKKKGADVRMFSFGIGTDVNTKLLDLLADQSRGYSQYVLPTENIEVSVSNFFAKVQDPVIAGVKVDTGTANATKLYPKEMPDLFKGDQLVVFGSYSKAAKTAIVVKGMVNGKEETFAQDVEFADKTDSANEWIGKLWATRRVGYLLDEIRLRGESKELKDEVVELARKWGVVTPYTAMLIIEDERRRGVPVAVRSLREMEADGAAVFDAARSTHTLAADNGTLAVNNTVNSSAYKSASSVEGASKAYAQTDARFRLSEATGRKADVAARGGLDKDTYARDEITRVQIAATSPATAGPAPTIELKKAEDGALARAAGGDYAISGAGGTFGTPGRPASSPVASAGQAQAKELNLGNQSLNGWNYNGNFDGKGNAVANASGRPAEQQAQGYRVVNNYAQQNRVINNRSFYLNGNQWTDVNVQKIAAKNKAEPAKVKIKFATREYFDLLKKHPEAAQYMALGSNITIEIEGTVYDIVDEQ